MLFWPSAGIRMRPIRPVWVAKTPWRCNWRHCAALEGDSVAREVPPAWTTIWTSWDYGIGIVVHRTGSDPKSHWRPFVRGQGVASRGMASVTVMQSAQQWQFDNVALIRRFDGAGERTILVEGPVSPMFVIISSIIGEDVA
jgi:hypothetical protein